MRSHADIVKRLAMFQTTPTLDIFGFQGRTLLDFLPFELARPFLDVMKLTPGIDVEWNNEVSPLTELHVEQAMRTYMTFAIEKAVNHRGLSAYRSIEKMKAWLWLRGDDELLGKIECGEIPFKNYGAPILRAICKAYTFDFPSDGTLANMADARPCTDDCQEGC